MIFYFILPSLHSMTSTRKILPDYAKPISYTILIDTNTKENVFSGSLSVSIDILKPTNTIKINAKKLSIIDLYAEKKRNMLIDEGYISDDKQQIDDTSYEILDTKYEINEDEQTIDIHFASMLQQNDMVNLYIHYYGSISTDMDGYYISKGDNPIYSTHFEPTSARTAFPCFDQPDHKANFKIMLLVPQKLVALSNCEVDQEKILETSENEDDDSGYCTDSNEKSESSDSNNEEIQNNKNMKIDENNKVNDNENSNIQKSFIASRFNKKILKKTNNDKLIIFKDSPVMSTYLVAWVIGDIHFIERVSKYPPYIKLRVYGFEKDVKYGEYALNVAHDCINFFQNYFSIEYPLSKIDMVGIPEFAMGAMENWGLITYRKSSLYYNVNESSFNTKKVIADTVCHELAHQWFGNLATMKWWNDLWLNEGFATWASALAMSNLDKSLVDWDVWTSFISDDVEYGMGYDSLHSTHPIQVEVNDPDDIDQIFDGISYSKGASLIRMLEDYLTPQKFREGLSNYLKRFAYENAETEDLWEELGKAGKKDVKNVMDYWVTKEGFPLIYVKEDNGHLKIKQERFFYIKEYNKQNYTMSKSSNDFEDLSWFVPLRVHFMRKDKEEESVKKHKKDNIDNKITDCESVDIKADNKAGMNIDNDVQNAGAVLVEFNTKTYDEGIQKKSDIYKFNHEGTGFYRVLYENQNNITNLLELPSLSSKNKLNIMNDLFQSSIASYIPYKIPYKASKYFYNECNYNVIFSVLAGLSEIKGIFYNDKEKNDIKKVILDLVKDRISIINLATGGINKNQNNEDDNNITNPEISKKSTVDANILFLNNTLINAAVMNDHKETIELLSKKYTEFKVNKKVINPTFRKAMYAALVKNNEEGVFDELWNMYKNESADDVKNQILIALGSTNEKKNIQFLLEKFFGNEILLQDKIYLIAGLIGNLEVRNEIFEFVFERYNDIKEMFKNNKSLFTNVIERVFSCISDSERREKALSVVGKEIKGIERAVQKSMERSAIKIKFRETNVGK